MPTNARVDAWAAQLNFAGLERKHGLPAGVLTNLVFQESKGNENAVGPQTKYGKAKGLCQILDTTAKELKCDPMDPASAIQGAARYLEDLKDMFGGDMDKAIAAYNWGPGNMRRAVREHGANWRNALPKETRDYLRIVGGGIGSTYEQRAASGEATEEDREAEDQRRRGRLNQYGFGDAAANMAPDDLLGQMFFALISMAIEKAMERSGQMQEEATPTTPAPTNVPDGTAVSPSAAPAQSVANRDAAQARVPA